MKNIIFLATLFFALVVNWEYSYSQSIFNWYARMTGSQQMWDGTSVDVWGFDENIDGDVAIPGPTMIVKEGEQVTLNITNQSPLAHTVHLHGLDVDQLNDGVPQTSFEIPGMMGTGSYSFTAPHAGTYMYHCHVESVVHFQMGMYGAIIVLPSDGSQSAWTGGPEFNKEYLWISSEIDKSWHDNPPSANDIPPYKPQYFLVNGKAKQQLLSEDVSVDANVGDVVLVRMVNAGYGMHRYLFPPQLNATIIDSDGRPLPAFIQNDTLDIFPGERYMALLIPDSAFEGSVSLEYFDLYDDDVLFLNEIPVKYSSVNSTSELNFDFNIQVAPNPTTSNLNVAIFPAIGARKNISLYNIKGECLLSQYFNSSSVDIDAAQFPSGQYILRVKIGSALKSTPVLLSH